MGDLTKGTKKIAREQRDATIKSAELTAAADRYAVQAAQQQSETMMAQDKAAREAAEKLSAPLESVDVALGSNTEAATVDGATGKRRTARSKFTTPTNSGIRI